MYLLIKICELYAKDSPRPTIYRCDIIVIVFIKLVATIILRSTVIAAEKQCHLMLALQTRVVDE